jgi:putative ABC transport system permease protein
MLISYIKLAWRNLLRKKIYSFINLTGLGVASAFCILVYWYVQHETSFDKFHTNNEQLYRLEFNNFFGFSQEVPKKGFFSFLNKQDEERHLIQSPVVLAHELKQRFPEIKEAVRIRTESDLIIKVNDESFSEKRNAAYVDPSFFKSFSFPLKVGNVSSVFKNLNEVIISEKAAEKYFGNANPLGRTIVLSNRDQQEFIVSAIVADFPSNSSFQFDLLFPRQAEKGYEESIKRGLNSFGDFLIIQLNPGVDRHEFERNLNAFGKQYFQNALNEMASHPGSKVKPGNFRMFLRPFSDAHYVDSGNWGHFTDKEKIYQLIFLALITLCIAAVNYVLLSLANSVSRSHEVGIRKTIGAPKRQIVFQFYIETQLLAILSVLAGFIIAILCLPLFSNLVGEPLQLQFFPITTIIAGLFLLALAIGIIAGIYPAQVLSGLKPVSIMRKFSSYRLNPFLAKTFAVIQFSICIILIISSLTITKQIRFMNEASLGFDTDLVISVKNPYQFGDTKNSYRFKERFEHYASSDPALANITTTWFPFQGYNSNGHLINGERVTIQDLNIDYNYFSFFNIPIIKGRNFSREIKEDSSNIELAETQKIPTSSAVRRSVIINETLYNLLGHPPLNELNRELGGTIIGVCKDYHADDLTKKIAPAYHRIEKGYFGYFWMKIKPGRNLSQVIEQISSNWKSLSGGEPFSYTFLDEDIAKSYETYLRWMRTITVSCMLAIIIACLGLFGLSGITTINRVKEIGIRKVLGASVGELFVLLNKSSLIIALVSFLIAVPIALYLLDQWLQNFAYRINLSWTFFILGGIISVATALIAVSYHTIKTARANPVKSLRTE